jgi:hypothetical protein
MNCRSSSESNKKSRIQVFQRIRCAGREICLASPFCLDVKIVNVISSFPAGEEMEKLVWQRRFQTTKS